ncbi:MAG TPA: glucose-6-phosphate isomerase [Burkholderiaceae bacterium]|jgi:glucose-6-phosphate isomerase|nr:glucose-6-phosphate isomerase [Burkholderiaceae bacterium]
MLTDLPAWNALTHHCQTMRTVRMRDLFVRSDGDARVAALSVEAAGLHLDYSKNRITPETMALLMQLAEEAGVLEARDAMLAGKQVNTTEQRAALHVALRAASGEQYCANGEPVGPAVAAVLARMRDFSDAVRSGTWCGHDGQAITDVINIGIGGSDLGPRMACRALSHLASPRLRMHFVSNVDGVELTEILARVQPATTLVIVCSKTFTTLETMTNAHSTRDWFLAHGVPEAGLARHFVAVSTNTDAVRAFGIDPANMFEFWDWVGGRYSLWSAVGLSIVLSIGYERFAELLAGAHAMDRHFATAEPLRNMPLILGMLGVWYRNFFDSASTCMAPYSASLELFPFHLQQLEMESNGKSVRKDGTPVSYRTSPIVWGTAGTNGQHAYFELLHQGMQLIPVDFIVPLKAPHTLPGHHAKVLANCFAQGEALMHGRTLDDITAQGVDPELAPHLACRGNQPSNTLLLPALTPHAVGALVALYEHRTFVQGAIWDINSFDQWGVELGKVLAKPILEELNGGASHPHDASTAALIRRARG